MSAQAAPRTARKRRARWAIAALVTVALVAAGVIAYPMVMGATQGKTTTVSTTPAEAGRLVVTASADGATEPVHSYDVYSKVGGTVTDVDVVVGKKVKAGDELFTVDDDDLQATLRQASLSLKQAKQQVSQSSQQLEQAELQLIQAENNLDDLESQTGSRSPGAAKLEEAAKSVEIAEAGVTSAEASLANARESRDNASDTYNEAYADLDDVTAVAPADGIVVAVNVTEGFAVSAGSGSGSSAAAGGTSGGATTVSSGSGSSSTGSSVPVVIADTATLQVTVSVNEVDISDVKAGQEATVTFDAVDGLEIPAKVAWVSPNAQSDGSVTTYEVRMTLSKQDARLRSGMTATADVVTLSVDEAVLVPKSSVKVDGTTRYVTVVGASGAQEKRVITTGASDDTRIQVLTGLAAGEQVTTTSSAAEAASDMRGAGMMMGGAAGGPPSGGSRPSAAPSGGN